jgi:DNA-binding NarL/FixJ family response regulator
MKLPNTLLADDHAIIVDGIRSLLRGHANVLGTFGDGVALLDATYRLQPDLVVTDISMPRLSGLEFLRRLQTVKSPARVVVLSMYGDVALVTAAVRAGARAYIPKHAAGEELVEAIGEVMAGRIYVSPLIGAHKPRATPAHGVRPPSQLTRRQREVLQLVAAGKRMKEIAAQLKLSRRTVEMHKYDMMRVLGLSTTAELIQYFVKHEVGTELDPLEAPAL